jgi:hypothetical protein
MVARLKLGRIIHFSTSTMVKKYTNKNATRYRRWTVNERKDARRLAYTETKTWIDEYGVPHVFSTRAALINKELAQVRIGTKVYLVTHLASLRWSRLRRPPKHWFDELSHSCGVPFCLLHGNWELPWVNSSRDGCHKYGYFERCPHFPRCLRQPNLRAAREALHAGIKEAKEAKEALLTSKQRVKSARNAKYYQARKDEIATKNREHQREIRGTLPENYR